MYKMSDFAFEIHYNLNKITKSYLKQTFLTHFIPIKGVIPINKVN